MHARLTLLAADLRRLFGSRLQSLVAYGDLEDAAEGTHTLALVDQLTFQDLAACAPLVSGWQRAGLDVPLLLGRDEFVRTLDVFPLEYGGIIGRHVTVVGDDPFRGVRVEQADLRRACEQQVKSHLIHLREGYLEAGGQPVAVGRLIAASAPALTALIANLGQLDPGIDDRAGLTPELVREIAAAAASTIADPSPLFARYVAAVERLWSETDRWKSTAGVNA
jgi:hypothetical protein